MDGKFRLIFADRESTPSGQVYLGETAIVCDRLQDAIRLGSETNVVWSVPFIAHEIRVLEPMLIDLLYRELLAGAPINPTSSAPTPGSPC